tara:strand:- start:194 stop:571 length:378 start_codon:yes stop_codon:yes gene_type:complete
MIYGIGTDLVDLDRIKRIKSLSTFARKILGSQELQKYQQLTDGYNQSYIGKQFAGKEAFVKALGTGFKKPIFPRDIQILRNSFGQPEVLLSDEAKSYIENLGITKTHVSLADESNHLIAFAVLET